MKRLASIFTFLYGICFLASGVYAASDNKYYSEFVFKHKLNDKFDLFFTPEFRVKNDMSNTYYAQLRAGTAFHANKYLDLAAAYRYIQTKDSTGDWSNNDTQYIEFIATPKIKLAGFNLSDANKLERRFIENATDRWVYRNLITAAHLLNVGGFEFTPYVSNEAYYDFEIDKVNLNWATIGANKKINKNLTVGLYYRDEISRVGSSSKWSTSHILGSNISVDF